MLTFLGIVSVLQSMSIALGVGCSTLAIINFFAAIADGVIDETERRMMGVVYVVLRVAMVLILVTTIMLAANEYGAKGLENVSVYTVAQVILLIALYTNAMLMSARIMPSTFGPAIQAGSWYALGFLSAIALVGWLGFSLVQFAFAYVTWLILAVAIVNGVMIIMKNKQMNKEKAT